MDFCLAIKIISKELTTAITHGRSFMKSFNYFLKLAAFPHGTFLRASSPDRDQFGFG